MAEVVCETGRLDDVGVAADRGRQVAADLRDLERVGQPVADEVVAGRADDLRLRGQPAKGRRVHDPGSVAFEGRPVRPALLVEEARGVSLAVDLGFHRSRPYCAATMATAASADPVDMRLRREPTRTTGGLRLRNDPSLTAAGGCQTRILVQARPAYPPETPI